MNMVWHLHTEKPFPGMMVLAWGIKRGGLREFYVAEWTGSTWMARGPHWNTIVNVLGWAEFAPPEDTLSSPETGGEETLSPELMHSKGSPGRTSVGDTFNSWFPCYFCGHAVDRLSYNPRWGHCLRCKKLVTERVPPPGKPRTFACPKGHTASRIVQSANGWCDECNDIVSEEEE